MDEQQWLACEDPAAMLDELAVRRDDSDHRGYRMPSDRKLRLFTVACCRQRQEVFKDPKARRCIDVAERYADGAATSRDRGIAFNVTDTIANSVERLPVMACLRSNADLGASHISEYFNTRGDRTRQAALLREIVGNPYQPRPEWWQQDLACPWLMWALNKENGLIWNTAKRIYDERDFAALPILADMLDDAECPEGRVLEHLRSPGPHTRGCWALDLILGRE